MTTQATENKEVKVPTNPIATGEIANDKLTAEQVNEILGEVAEGYTRVADTFNFRTKKVTDPETGEELKDKAFKPDSVRVHVNVPTLAKLMEIAAADEKVADMLLSLVTGEILKPVKAKIEELYEAGVPATLEALKDALAEATVEKAAIDFATTGRETLSDEAIDAALKDFALYHQKQGREQAKVAATVNVIKGKFAKIRSNKEMLQRVAAVFLEWAGSDASVAEQHGMFIKRTGALLEKLINAEEKDLSADLL